MNRLDGSVFMNNSVLLAHKYYDLLISGNLIFHAGQLKQKGNNRVEIFGTEVFQKIKRNIQIVSFRNEESNRKDIGVFTAGEKEENFEKYLRALEDLRGELGIEEYPYFSEFFANPIISPVLERRFRFNSGRERIYRGLQVILPINKKGLKENDEYSMFKKLENFVSQPLRDL